MDAAHYSKGRRRALIWVYGSLSGLPNDSQGMIRTSYLIYRRILAECVTLRRRVALRTTVLDRIVVVGNVWHVSTCGAESPMCCDVGQYVPQGDCPDSKIENILHSNLQVLSPAARTSRRGRRSFAPGGRIELPVLSADGRSLLLVAYRAKEEFYAELHWNEIKLRALHTHSGHRNPGSPERMPDGHMHFPTRQCPLIGNRSTYAYEEDCDYYHDLNSFVEAFCLLLNIDLEAYQLVLGHGGR